MHSSVSIPDAARPPSRVVITNIQPSVECGRFPVKRCVGELVVVSADIHADGHDVLSAVLRYRHKNDADWAETVMQPLGNDAWQGTFNVLKIGQYEYHLQSWINPFLTWQHDLGKRVAAGQDVSTDLQIGARLLLEAATRASGAEAEELRQFAQALQPGASADPLRAVLPDIHPRLARLMWDHAPRPSLAESNPPLSVTVDRERAGFSAWYEMFPRSCARQSGQHGTLKDCADRLPYIASMNFDVLYLPPIHPIGRTHRKGRNGNTICSPGDVGSPWAIGSEQGGHTAIHPQLGTLEDFRSLLTKAAEYNVEIALDLAFQCSPDHPWVKQHPEWFRHRPDGTIQHAENPPKKYEDIVPLNFDSAQWRELWEELRRVVFFWMEQGVRIFRVDNPHTKPYDFWEWLISEARAKDPGVIFLSEAFTRPKVMYRLAQLGFTQSYTYFTWRNTKQELVEYLTELTQSAVREFFRPNFWPNTPDILHEYLQSGGRPAFLTRLVLAATLSPNYGIYGPAFELCENQPRSAGSEEYLNAEKYEIRTWDLDSPHSLKEWIGKVNRIRREQPALRQLLGLRFQAVDNDLLLAYTKSVADLSNVILVVVNLDPYHTQCGWVELPLEDLGLEPQQPFQVRDLLTDERYLWQGRRNYVELNPHAVPAHIFHIRRGVHTERDFDYYL